MAAAPTPAQRQRALRRAAEVAVKHLDATGIKYTPRYIQASNGEGAIVFDRTLPDGNIETKLTLE